MRLSTTSTFPSCLSLEENRLRHDSATKTLWLPPGCSLCQIQPLMQKPETKLRSTSVVYPMSSKRRSSCRFHISRLVFPGARTALRFPPCAETGISSFHKNIRDWSSVCDSLEPSQQPALLCGQWPALNRVTPKSGMMSPLPPADPSPHDVPAARSQTQALPHGSREG